MPWRVIGLVAFCVLGQGSPLADGTQARSENPEPPCSGVFRQSVWDAAAVSGPEGGDIDPEIRRAMTQFRFHRRDEALARLRSLDARLHGQYAYRLPEPKRTALVASVRELTGCVARFDARPLASVTVRVFVGAGSTTDSRGPRASPGVLLLVDDIIAGRTDGDGTLTLPVPSGPIRLRAEVHGDYGAVGEAAADFLPGTSGEVAIVLGEGAHPAYRTELVLLEAINDTVRVSSPTFTLQFRENGAAVRIAALLDAELLDADLREQAALTQQFRVARGQIAARRAQDLLAKLPTDSWMYLNVLGRDATGVHRNNIVRLRVTR